jgi:hypothetical protein
MVFLQRGRSQTAIARALNNPESTPSLMGPLNMNEIQEYPGFPAVSGLQQLPSSINKKELTDLISYTQATSYLFHNKKDNL